MVPSIRLLLSTLIVLLIYCGTTQAQYTLNSVTPNPVCAGSPITINYTTTTPVTTFFTLIGPSPSTTEIFLTQTNTPGANLTVPALIPTNQAAGSYIVRMINGAGQSTTSSSFVINVLPAAPMVSNVAYCLGATNIPPLTATGQNLRWYLASSGDGGTTVAPTPPTSATGTTNYYVSQTDANGCESPRANLQVTINSPPAKPTVVTSLSYCQNTTPVSLSTGVSSGTNLRWYTNPTGGEGTTVAPSPSTTAVGQNTYYVSQVDNNGCESDRAVITFIVNGYPAAPGVSPVAYCQNATATSLTATPAANATLNFYILPTGGTRFSSLIPSTTSSRNYYVSQTVNGCESPRATITVSINSLPPRPAVTTPITYCQLSPAVPLSATANTNFSLNWYGTDAIGGSASTIAPIPSTNTAGPFSYYVTQQEPFGCESERAPISVTVYAKPATPVTTPASACLNAMPNPLTTSIMAMGAVKWYTESSGGTGSTVAPTLSTSATGSVTYYVSQTDANGCESDRAAITFTVNPLPTPPTVAAPFLFFCQNSVATSLTATGTNLKWYTVNAGGTALPNPVTPSTDVAGPSVAYYVSQTDANGCESTRTTLTVTVISRPVPPTVYAVMGVHLLRHNPIGRCTH